MPNAALLRLLGQSNAWDTDDLARTVGQAFGATLQAGTTKLTVGVSPLIPAALSATSRIVVSVKTPAGGDFASTYAYAAPAADRDLTAQMFRVRALNAGGVANAGDASDVDWLIIDLGV